MDAITYTHARSHLAETMEKVCDDHAPVIITRKNQRSVVMLSLEDYQALEETAYLLRSPKNARRLLESIAELEAGGGTERELRGVKLIFSEHAWEDYLYWQRTDRKILQRINTLIRESQRAPFEGIGKPEPLEAWHVWILVTAHH